MNLRKNKIRQQRITCKLTNEHLPLRILKELIDRNMIQDEIPFELLAVEYPSLLEEWYPGYPGFPREMNEGDPICAMGHLKNGTVTLDIAGLVNSPIPCEGAIDLEGKYKMWLKKEGDSWSIYIAMPDTSEA